MTRRPRVLWLVKTLARGGAQKALCSTAARLDRSRYDVEVAMVLSGHDALAPSLARRGIAIHDLGGRRTLDPRWVRAAHRLIVRGRFDLVHTHSPAPAAVVRVICPRARFMHTEHSEWPHHHPLTRAANAATFSRNRAVVAVSAAVARSIARPSWWHGRWPDTTEIVYHGVEPASPPTPQSRGRARERLGLSREGGLVIGAVGALESAKGYATLLRAFALLGGTPWLVLVGSGPEGPRLRALAAALGVADRVRFAGARDDVGCVLDAFDVFAHPSRAEGFGLAVLEAMAARVPVICSSVGGLPELTAGAGALVPPDDEAALASALCGLLTDGERRRRLGEAGRRRAGDFAPDTAVRRLEVLYEQVLQATP